MKKYKCNVCGHEFSENDAASENGQVACSVCRAPSGMLTVTEHGAPEPANVAPEAATVAPGSGQGPESAKTLDYPADFSREDSSVRYMDEIHQMAVTGETIIEAMGTGAPMPGWDEILILGAQLDPMPLESHEEVDTETVIGKRAKKPMTLANPIYISHMSFGALSREAKIALAKGSAMAKAAMCSGEGGILPEEKAAAHKYIFEYVPNRYSVTEENLRDADAIEIKIGQGTKPGLGGHLPGGKGTGGIAAG
ncbi:MAG: glutamate synthase-related protein, partial [Clostridiales bacterium]|nr:glutamate synthase-related protein [Clostridiales bacterium]